jgi:hypothetical protein
LGSLISSNLHKGSSKETLVSLSIHYINGCIEKRGKKDTKSAHCKKDKKHQPKNQGNDEKRNKNKDRENENENSKNKNTIDKIGTIARMHHHVAVSNVRQQHSNIQKVYQLADGLRYKCPPTLWSIGCCFRQFTANTIIITKNGI